MEQNNNIQQQPCGTCRECCWALTIKSNHADEEEKRKVETWISSGQEIKPAGTPCPQMNQSKLKFGCSIHNNEDKPSLCSTYLCAYARGWLGNKTMIRPDRSGVIIDLLEGNKIRITELTHKALESSLVKRQMWSLADKLKNIEGDKTEWTFEIIPKYLMGQGLGVSVPISALSIGRK